MTLNKDGLEAARNAVGTIPGAALWSAVEKAITAYLAALPDEAAFCPECGWNSAMDGAPTALSDHIPDAGNMVPAPDGLVERLLVAADGVEKVSFDRRSLRRGYENILREAATVIQTLQREGDELVGERDAALREAQDKDIRYRTWREFYGALLAVPASSATPLEVRAHRQANIITDMQYRIKCLRQEIRRHIRRDHLDPPMKGYRIGQHVNKLHKLWRDAEARAEAAEQQVRDMRGGLTPSAETKAAYIGEFQFNFVVWDPHGEFEITHRPIVPWTTIKEIMAAIRDRADARLLLKEGGE
jgi:hypothetical protein